MVLGGLVGGLAGGAAVSIVISAVDNYSKQFKKAGGAMSKFGTAVVTGFAVAGTAATVLGVASVKAFASVETGFAKVNTLLGEGENAQELYGDSVRRVSNEMGLQGGEVAALNGLYQTISAGITDTAEATEFLEAASIAAIGGSAELSAVINVGTKTMAAFGDEAGSVTDVMDTFAAAVVAGQTTMPELANAFPKVAGLAAEMGMSLDETAGAFAGLTKVTQNSDVTATGMKATLTQLLKPQADLQAGLENIGFASGKAAIEELGLVGTLDALQKSVDGDVVALGAMFGNVRAITTVLPAVGKAADEISASMDIMANKTDLSAKQFDDMDKTSAQGFTKLKNTFMSTLGTIGAELAPAITPVLEGIQGLLAGFDSEKVGAFVASLKEGLLPVFNTLKETFEAIQPAIQVIWEAMQQMFKIIKPYARDFVDTVLTTMQSIFTTIGEWVTEHKPQIEGLFKALGVLGAIMFNVLGKIFKVFESIFNLLVKAGFIDFIIWGFTMFAKILSIVWGVIGLLADALTWFFDLMGKGIDNAVLIFSNFGDVLENRWLALVDILKSAWTMFANFFKNLWTGLKNFVFTIINFWIGLFENLINNIVDAVNWLIDLYNKMNDKVPAWARGASIATIGNVSLDRLQIEEISAAEPIDNFGANAKAGSNAVVNIENLYGTDPSDIAQAIQEQLSDKILL